MALLSCFVLVIYSILDLSGCFEVNQEDLSRIGPSEPGFLPGHALRFVEQPETVVALPGDSVYFNCKTAGGASANGGPEEIRWLHNGSLIVANKNDNHSDHSESRTSGGRGSQLTFKVHGDPRKFEQQLGEYRCVAGGAGGIFVASHPATLKVARMGELSHFSSRSKEVEAFVGNDIAIDCRVPPSDPPAVIQFFKDDKPIEQLSDLDSDLLNGETLLVRGVDQSDAGKFTCSATNHITSQTVRPTDFTQLRVRTSEMYEKSRLTYRPKERYEVLIGDNLTIPCLASGHPKPEIIWTRATLNLNVDSNERLPSNHGCLNIVNASELDGGSYMCAIYNGARRFLRKTNVVVLTPPVFTKTPEVNDGVEGIPEGSSVFLHCQARGTPVPKIEWFFNGLPVRQGGHKKVLTNGTLTVPFARLSSDQGVYQCFASNKVGTDAATPVTLRIARGNSSLYEESYDEDEDPYSEEELAFWHRPALLDHLATVPPSRPEVEQSGRNSALLTWSVDAASGTLSGESMPVQFFKVQFREFCRGGVRSHWRTIDDVINPRSRSFEVLGLKDDVRYRFRVVAVYANDDNLHGPLSRKFKLNKDLDSEKAPRSAPVITQVLPLGPKSLRVGWKMNSAVSPAVVEGYFIYIRKLEYVDANNNNNNNNRRQRKRKRAGKYSKVTIIGHASHSYIFDQLEPGTLYEIKVEAFNFAGKSPPSRISRRSTWPADDTNQEPTETQKETGQKDNSTTVNKASPAQDVTRDLGSNDRVLIYVAIAGGIAVVVLSLVLCCSVISCAQRARARKSFDNNKNTASSSSNRGYVAGSTSSAIHDKYSDTSRSISMSMMAKSSSQHFDHSNHQKYFGGGVDRLQLPPSPSSSRLAANEAETSFLQRQPDGNNLSPSSAGSGSAATTAPALSSNSYSSNVGFVCREPLGPSRRPNSSSSVSSSRSSLVDKSSLGYEVYTDEPSVVSWKRRRQSEEIL